MGFPGKKTAEAAADPEFSSLVEEMDQIRDRVDATLHAQSSWDDENRPSPSDAPLDEMLGGMGREEIDSETAALGGPTAVPQDGNETRDRGEEPGDAGKVIPLGAGKTAPAPETAMSLSVLGAIRIRLELTRQDQSIEIRLEETELRVELSDGTHFRIPLNKSESCSA